MLKVVLIYISLVTKDDEKVLRHLLATPPHHYFENFPVQVSGKFFFFFERVMDGVNVSVGQDVDLGGSYAVQSGRLGPPPPPR